MKGAKNIYRDNGVEINFVDTSTEVKRAIEKLSKEALGASAKVIRKKLRETAPIRTNRIRNHIGSWKFIDRSTGQPTLQIGFYSWQRVKKKGKLPSHASPHWIEFGTKSHIIQPKKSNRLWLYGSIPRMLVHHPGQGAQHILKNAIENNTAEIRAAQEEYLLKINEVMDIEKLKIKETAEEEND